MCIHTSFVVLPWIHDRALDAELHPTADTNCVNCVSAHPKGRATHADIGPLSITAREKSVALLGMARWHDMDPPANA
jgi:hypothetical protein